MTLSTFIITIVTCIFAVAFTVFILIKYKVDLSYLMWGAAVAYVILYTTLAISTYTSPHHGIEPTYEDVAENQAKVDTVYTVCDKDTTISYIINWKK